MTLVWILLYWILFIFFLLMLGRLVLSWIQVFAPTWRPKGFMLIVAEAIYTPTDPPLKAVGKLVPPLNIGGIRLDLAFLIVFILVGILMQVAGSLM